MKANRLSTSFGATLAATLCLTGLLAGGPLDEMASAIEHDLDARCVGYGYTIYRNGNYVRGGGGGTRYYGDPENIYDPGLPFDHNTVKDCHSMSKTITAAALLKALGDAGVSLNAKIWLYLPKEMQDAISDNDIKDITFRDLLSHRSGFGASTSYSWELIKSQLQGGLANSIGTYEYSNWNYAACRLLIPYLIRENYYRGLEAETPVNQLTDALNNLTSQDYIAFVQSEVFDPAGLPTIHPRPVGSTMGHFAWYYDFVDPTVPGALMPDRRLTVGSGGWAMSAKQYGKFISGIFNNQIVSGTQLGWMEDDELAMFDRSGSNGTFWSHNGATTSGTVGGRSAWMHFPADNLQAVIQVNSARNSYDGYGMGLDRILEDAYEKSFGTPLSETQYPLHLFVRRSDDGWLASRGVRTSGNLGDRNDDLSSPGGFTHARFLSAGGQTYVLHYHPNAGGGKGRAVMQRVNQDGTLGAVVFDQSNWRQGWTQVETFRTFNGTYLLLHNQNDGTLRTHKVSVLGTVGPALTDGTYTTGFNVVEILDFGGDPHLFRHNSTTGHTHLRRLNDDGSVGATAYDKTWMTGFTDFAFYQAGGSNYLLRYRSDNGHARIISFGNSLQNTNLVLDQNWTPGWEIMRFLEIGNQTFNFRYNPADGEVRMQEINNNGTFGDVEWQSGAWLRATEGTSAFDPDTTGWTEVEFYDATPGFTPPNQVAGNPNLPVPHEGPAATPLQAEFIALDPEVLKPVRATFRTLRGRTHLEWEARSNELQVIEESPDLRHWRVVEIREGRDAEMNWTSALDPAGAARSPQKFVRIRTIPALPAVDLQVSPR